MRARRSYAWARRSFRVNIFVVSLGDVWHRTLVYFGIAEEYDDGWDEEYLSEDGPPPAAQPAEQAYADRSRTNVRRLPRRRDSEYDYDDWTSGSARAAEEASPRQARPQAVPPADAGLAQVHLVVPRGFNDAKQIADRFKRSVPVIVNLQDADVELSKRLIDFASGLTYALNGSMQRIADKVFLLTPPNIEVSAEERAKALERGGFYNQA
jgi:cell division inhibitor SepF